jgi:hypothetical protein
LGGESPSALDFKFSSLGSESFLIFPAVNVEGRNRNLLKAVLYNLETWINNAGLNLKSPLSPSIQIKMRSKPRSGASLPLKIKKKYVYLGKKAKH